MFNDQAMLHRKALVFSLAVFVLENVYHIIINDNQMTKR